MEQLYILTVKIIEYIGKFNKEEGEEYTKKIYALFFDTTGTDHEDVEMLFNELTKYYIHNIDNYKKKQKTTEEINEEINEETTEKKTEKTNEKTTEEINEEINEETTEKKIEKTIEKTTEEITQSNNKSQISNIVNEKVDIPENIQEYLESNDEVEPKDISCYDKSCKKCNIF